MRVPTIMAAAVAAAGALGCGNADRPQGSTQRSAGAAAPKGTIARPPGNLICEYKLVNAGDRSKVSVDVYGYCSSAPLQVREHHVNTVFVEAQDSVTLASQISAADGSDTVITMVLSREQSASIRERIEALTVECAKAAQSNYRNAPPSLDIAGCPANITP